MPGLADILLERIARQGPLSVAEYMAEALGHPEHGYYATRDPLGAAGDFVTAPEVSQMFGELIGLWCAVVWQAAGRPDPVNLVELGPGRGTLMADLLRAARTVPGFAEALSVHLVETSPVLRAAQKAALADVSPSRGPVWHDSLESVPDGPLLVVANEFFDALPIRQFRRTDAGWCERLIAAGPGKARFEWTQGPPVERPPGLSERLPDAPVGAIVETAPAAAALAGALGERLAGHGIAALIVDYGYDMSAPGDTLQAVRNHRFADPLADPGEADLTAHVDFEALLAAGAAAGARPFASIPQGTFLESIGLGARAEALTARASPAQATDIRAARQRLADPRQMGALFRAAALQHPGLPPPPGWA